MKPNLLTIMAESRLDKITNSQADEDLSLSRQDTESQQEEDEDSRSYLDDDFLDEDDEDEKTTNKTVKGGKKSGGFVSRRNSAMSRKGGKDPRKDFKRMNTNMSRMSKTSRVSRYSRNSGKSVYSARSRVSKSSVNRRYQGGFFSHYAENTEEEEKEHPFDAIFGKNIYRKMKKD